MVVEFRVLGEVEARVDGQLVDLGHARQRCVLVTLLVEANHPVSADQLVDRVWGEQPPLRARDTLYSYLSRLRHALATVNEVSLMRQYGGYVLTVDPPAVDLHRFHHLVTQARGAQSEDDALSLFEQALGLWQGEAFAGLDTAWLNSQRDGLERERLAVELDRNDLQLRGGQHPWLLTGLSTQAAAHPLDERLAGQLMLALYRCGRQADALEHFHQMRLRLAEELGIDPGPPLQRLYQQILTTDPALTAPTRTTRSAPASPEPPVPAQLPADVDVFTGRVAELAELDRLLTITPTQTDATETVGGGSTAVVISAVSGTAGVGKTALALRWAHRVRAQFPDGQLYVNLRGYDPDQPLSAADALAWFLRALGVTGQDIPLEVRSAPPYIGEDLLFTEIAVRIGRDPSVVSRDVGRHGGRAGYRAVVADQAACAARERPKLLAVERSARLRAVVCRQLRCGWSPGSIAGRLPTDYPEDQACRVSHEAIYQWVSVPA